MLELYRQTKLQLKQGLAGEAERERMRFGKTAGVLPGAFLWLGMVLRPFSGNENSLARSGVASPDRLPPLFQ